MKRREEWRPVPGWEDYYEVSNLGRVRRIKAALGTRAGKILKPYKNTHGHLKVALCRNAKRTEVLVHRLVALAFLPAPEDPGLYVCHRDGDPSNNRLGNLYYGTPRENGVDMVRHGRSRAKLTGGQVEGIRLALTKREPQRSIAKRFGISQPTVSAICVGRLWSHRTYPEVTL